MCFQSTVFIYLFNLLKAHSVLETGFLDGMELSNSKVGWVENPGDPPVYLCRLGVISMHFHTQLVYVGSGGRIQVLMYTS